jgi:hypothetical protein
MTPKVSPTLVQPNFSDVARRYLEKEGYSDVFVRMIKAECFRGRATKAVIVTAHDPRLGVEVEITVAVTLEGDPLFHS